MKHLNSNYSEVQGIGPLFDAPTHQVLKPNDSTTGQQLKEKGIKEVSEHNENWMEESLKFITWKLKKYEGFKFTGEDVRFWVQDYVGHPKHPNAFGAFISTLVKRKLIVPTGEYVQPKDKSSHARKIQVYTSNLNTVAANTATN